MTDIILKNIFKSFGNVQVFSDFSAVIPCGKCTAVMGPSGCGKTTLVNMLLSLEKPDSGTVTGVPEKLSAVFQEDRLCESFSPRGNIRLVTGASFNEDAVSNCLTSLGLDMAQEKPVWELSGGMKRRVAIARALLPEYDLLVMDEPFKGLDEDTKKNVMAYVMEQTEGKTVVLVTHDASEAEFLSDVIIRL